MVDDLWRQAYVAERDGKFRGAIGTDDDNASKWLASMAGCVIKTMATRDEYLAWLRGLKDG